MANSGKGSKKCAGTPKSIVPDPIELSKLAALLRPDDAPEKALNAAMSLYVEAVLFCQGLPDDFAAFVNLYGSEKRRLEVFAKPLEEFQKDALSDTLEFQQREPDDQARAYLRSKGLRINTAEGLHKNLMGYLNRSRSPGTLSPAGTPRALFREGKLAAILIPRCVLDGMVDYADARRRAIKPKAWKIRRSKPSQAKSSA